MAATQQLPKHPKVVLDTEKLFHEYYGFIAPPTTEEQCPTKNEGEEEGNDDFKRYRDNSYEMFTTIERFLDPSNTADSVHSVTETIGQLIPPAPAPRDIDSTPLGNLWGMCLQIAEQIPYNHPSTFRLAALVNDLSTQAFTIRYVGPEEGGGAYRKTVSRPQGLWLQYVDQLRPEFDDPDLPEELESERLLNAHAFVAILSSYGITLRAYWSLKQMAIGLEDAWTILKRDSSTSSINNGGGGGGKNSEEEDSESIVFPVDVQRSCYAGIAAQYIFHNGAYIFQQCAVPVRHFGAAVEDGRAEMEKCDNMWYPPSYTGQDLDDIGDVGSGYTMARWNAWKIKFKSIASGERIGASDEVKVLSQKAVRYMEALEDRLDF